MWYKHAVECRPALTSKGVLTQATPWMNPEDIMLSEMGQTRRDGHCVTLCEVPKRVKFTETEGRRVVATAGEQ